MWKRKGSINGQSKISFIKEQWRRYFIQVCLGAKLFLTSAMNKQKEADNLQKMSHKMDYMQGIIKNNAN